MSMDMPPQELRELLARKDVSQRELARRLGMDFRHINKMVAGNTPIKTHHAIAIRCVLGECATPHPDPSDP